jgi:transposase InsO family protein
MAEREVPMSVRRLIAEADLASLNVSRFCRDHGISRDSFYAWRRRFEAEGEDGLESRSRAPKRVANRISEAVEDLIVGLRKDLDDTGVDSGPATIQYWLAEQLPAGESLCSESTIWRALKRRGFIVADPTKAPGHQWRSFAAARANECWQMDSTHWALADDSGVEIINTLDDCTRLAIRARAVLRCTLTGVWDTITDGAGRYGWPERVLADNGSSFGPAFAENLAALGVELGHSRPYHPQTCGKVERFHLTEKKWLTAHDPAHTLTELQERLDAFVDYYNTQRPHRSLGRRIPSDVWNTTPHSGPANQPLGRPTTVHHNLVYDGVVWANRYRITIGAAYNTQRATIITTGTRCHVFIAGRLVRELTIDPTRADQPLHHRPGRPTT